MAPSKKDRKAFMDMMDSVIQNHMPPLMPCDCPQCQKRFKKTREYMSTLIEKESDKDSPSPSKNTSKTEGTERYLCPDHRNLAPSKRHTSAQKDKEKDKSSTNSSANLPNRNDKVNSLMKAESVQAVLDVFKSTPTTDQERDLSQHIQNAVADCKLFTESKAKIVEYCKTKNVDLDAVFGLLAKFRQERSILTSAMIKSNSEREKCLQAIHRVDDLMCMLKDVAKDGKGPSGDDLRHSLGNMICEIHELSKSPSTLYDELLDLREEHLDLLADHEEQHQKFLDVESCHEKLHEKNKKLMDDFAVLKQDYAEAKRKIGALGGVKNEVSQTEKALEIARGECADLKKEIERLNADTNKINALKHENAQLKKKVAAAEAAAVELKKEEKASDPIPANKKKKAKKNATSAVNGPQETMQPASTSSEDPGGNMTLQKEFRSLQQSNAEIQSQLDTAQTNLRQLEVLLKKSEVAKTKALERQQVEQATAQNWRELSEGHADESNRLKQQLDQSMSHATSLQETVHQLEQNLAETKDQLKPHSSKRPISPSITSQTSSTSKVDNESLRTLRRLRNETAQLVHDLDSAENYPGDPWNLVRCTRNMVAAIDRDLESVLPHTRDNETTTSLPETYLPFQRSDVGFQTPVNGARVREATPPLTTARPPTLPSYRPLLPPGLSESSTGRASPKPQQFPSPIGTGRPSRKPNGKTPSPVQPFARTAALPTSTAGIGNGSSVDWSMWSR